MGQQSILGEWLGDEEDEGNKTIIFAGNIWCGIRHSKGNRIKNSGHNNTMTFNFL